MGWKESNFLLKSRLFKGVGKNSIISPILNFYPFPAQIAFQFYILRNGNSTATFLEATRTLSYSDYSIGKFKNGQANTTFWELPLKTFILRVMKHNEKNILWN